MRTIMKKIIRTIMIAIMMIIDDHDVDVNDKYD